MNPDQYVPKSERGFLFVGKSGAGKSTLLDAFADLLAPPRWVDSTQPREKRRERDVIEAW
jgi:ABC-type nitrate/sulfonate/bicarbonate transport system ATPase subunit